MLDSTSVRALTRRWSRWVASVVGRSALAAVSVAVLVYGGVQLAFVTLRAMLPLPLPMLPLVSFVEIIGFAETLPPVRLVGPVTVDPVLNTTSLLTVRIAVGLVALGALGMTIAGTVPQLRQRTRSAKEEEGSLSAALPSVHDVFSVFHKSQTEVIQAVETLFMATGACIFMSWTATNILIPQVADAGGIAIHLLLMILVRIIPVVGVVCAVLAVGHAGWYGYRRWKAQPSARIEGGSR